MKSLKQILKASSLNPVRPGNVSECVDFVQEWIARRRGKPKYSNSFKIAIAREYLSGNLSSKELSEKYDLAFADAANYFARWYKQRYPNGLQEDGAIAQPPVETMVIEKGLSRQLQDANLKIAGLEMMIEIAQKELGIDIRKKPGTKQSQK